MTGHLSTLPTYNTLLAGDGLCELGPLRISSSMNYASQASTLVLDAPAVHTWPRTSCLLLWPWRKILQEQPISNNLLLLCNQKTYLNGDSLWVLLLLFSARENLIKRGVSPQTVRFNPDFHSF